MRVSRISSVSMLTLAGDRSENKVFRTNSKQYKRTISQLKAGGDV